jgi:uncharacterized C2H2 Zn-finger protein
MKTCLDCKTPFTPASHRSLRCPHCQAIFRKATVAKAVLKYTETHVDYRFRDSHDKEPSKKYGDRWTLIEAPDGCDFKPGAQFTAIDLSKDMAKQWVERGMTFKSKDGKVRRF